MSDEYEYGPWVGWNGGECPVGDDTLVQVCLLIPYSKSRGEIPETPEPVSRWIWRASCSEPIIAYRIATPKPKRELVVGKWYRSSIGKVWRKVIAVEPGGVWLTAYPTDRAYFWAEQSVAEGIDWSTPPRDEAPE